jgi:acetamidase/formamidase
VIRSGDAVHYDLLVGGHGNIWPGATFEEATVDFETIYSLSGPLYIEDAQPGDTLEIEILTLTPGARRRDPAGPISWDHGQPSP